MAMYVADDDIASNGGGENLSCHEDPNANPPSINSNSSKRLSTDAIDEKAEGEQKVPASLKSPPQGRGTGFSKEEILFLAKVYVRTSSDPIVGTSQSEENLYQQVCTIYNQLITGWKEDNDDRECVILLSFCTKYSLQIMFAIVYKLSNNLQGLKAATK